MSLRDSLIADAAQAERAAQDAARASAVVVVGPAVASAIESLPVPELAPSLPPDPEVLNALARSDSLAFSTDELEMFRGLSSKAIREVLENGAPKDKMAAAKLVLLLQRIEREAYLELRAQSRATHTQVAPAAADPEFIGRVAAAAASFRSRLGSGDVTARVIS